MFITRNAGYILTTLMIILVFSVPCTASVPPQNTPEIQQIKTTTGFDAIGMVFESDEITWRLSSEVLDNNIQFPVNVEIEPVDPQIGGHWNPIPDPENPDSYIGWEYLPEGGGLFDSSPYPDQPPGYQYTQVDNEPPLNPAGEVQMVSHYNEYTVAMNGKTTYIKNTGVVTSPQLSNKYNVMANKIVTFKGQDSGQMVSEENTLQENVGNSMTLVSQTTLCPFTKAAIGNCAPPSCNIVAAGSRVEILDGSFVTSAGLRSVAEDSGMDRWPPQPRKDGPPVELGYSISVKGIDVDPAVGIASAYIKAHKQEGGAECPSGAGGKAQDIVYSEVSTANGYIQQFHKVMNYQSGFSLSGCTTCG